MVTKPRLWTSGDVARALNCGVNRVRYILATRDHIRPVGRAGLVWLYDEAAVEAVKEVLLQRAREAEEEQVKVSTP